MEKKIEFKVGNETLRGVMFIPSGTGPFPSVIFFHGSGSTGETSFEAAKLLAENGILGFAFNFRGCGISDGKFEDQKIGDGAEDARAAIDFFLSQPEVDKERVGISGSSFGGFLASLLSANYNFKSMVLVAPAAYAPEVLDFTHDYGERRREFEKSDSYKEIAKYKGKLLVIQCEFDDVLSPGEVEKYIESARAISTKEHFLLKGSKHRISVSPEAKEVLKNKILDWFSKTL